MEINNRKIPVPADLKPFTDGVWYVSIAGTPELFSPMQRCLPNGAAQLIIHLTPQRHVVQVNSEIINMPEALLTSLSDGIVHWMAPGQTILLGVNLQPETVQLLFGRPLGEIKGVYEELAIFASPEIATDFISRFKGLTTIDALAEAMFDYLRDRLCCVEENTTMPAYFQEAMRQIRVAAGTQSVDDICEQVFVGKRQLQRVFQEFVGLSPKEYGQVVRFRHVYNFLERNPQTRLTTVTYQFGFSDQSHFIKEFKKFSGNKPKTVLAGVESPLSMPLAY